MADGSDIADRRRRILDDLQFEIAGADVGRTRRFLGPEDERTTEGKRKKEERDRNRATLEQLLLDPEYARLYVELGDRLREAETAADTALVTIQMQLEAAQEDIANMEDATGRDLNGNQVFRYADGRVVYADGTEVRSEIAEGIIWPPNAPTAEEYFAAKDSELALHDKLIGWGVYRNDVLGGIRDRYEDPGTPYADVNALQGALDQIERSRPVDLSLETTKSPEKTAADVTPSAFPTIPVSGQ